MPRRASVGVIARGQEGWRCIGDHNQGSRPAGLKMKALGSHGHSMSALFASSFGDRLAFVRGPRFRASKQSPIVGRCLARGPGELILRYFKRCRMVTAAFARRCDLTGCFSVPDRRAIASRIGAAAPQSARGIDGDAMGVTCQFVPVAPTVDEMPARRRGPANAGWSRGRSARAWPGGRSLCLA